MVRLSTFVGLLTWNTTGQHISRTNTSDCNWDKSLCFYSSFKCDTSTVALIERIIWLTPDLSLSSSSFSKLSCWVSDSLRPFFSQEFGWRPLQPFKVPQLIGSFGGEAFGQVPRSGCLLEVRLELMVRGVVEEGIDDDEEELGRGVLVGSSILRVAQVLSPLRESGESRGEQVGAGEMGVEERLEELASRAADLTPCSPPPILVRPLGTVSLLCFLECSSSPSSSSSSPVRPSVLLEADSPNLAT